MFEQKKIKSKIILKNVLQKYEIQKEECKKISLLYLIIAV